MKFEISNAVNGIMLNVTKAGQDQPETLVYQERMEGDDVEAFAEVLRLLDEMYGPNTSRYSAKRIRIVVEPGDKYLDLIAETKDDDDCSHRERVVELEGELEILKDALVRISEPVRDTSKTEFSLTFCAERMLRIAQDALKGLSDERR